MATSLTHLISRLCGLLSLVLALTGVWFVLDAIATPSRSVVWLAIGVMLLAIALAGRKLVLLGVKSSGRASLGWRPAQTEIVTGSGGSQLHVEAAGEATAPLIILTAGWGSDRGLWEGVAARLSDQFRVIVWDPAGAGLSTRPFDDHFTIDRFAGDLKAVLALGEGRPALLVGHGLGGMAVLDLCCSEPAWEVAGVVVLDTPVPDPASKAARALFLPMWRLDLWLSPLMQLMAWASFLNGSAHLIARTWWLGPNPSRETLDQVVRMAARHPPGVHARALEAARTWRFDPQKMRTPLLVASGEFDLAASLEACERLARSVCDGRCESIAGAGQMGPIEAPDLYAGAIARHAETAFGRAESRRRRQECERLRARSPAWSVAAEPTSFKAEEVDSLANVDSGSPSPLRAERDALDTQGHA